MSGALSCFKAYDIRGRVPDELNEDIARRIGLAYAALLQPASVAVGHDIRLSSRAICDALIDGLLEAGVDVRHIGLCGTEEIYFATAHYGLDGGIVVTASHNPRDYNGMKFVREGARPISGDSGLQEIRRLAERDEFTPAARRGVLTPLDHRADYIGHLLGYVDVAALTPLDIVVNAGNGGAGAIVDALESHLPHRFIKVHHQADGRFPHGVPNPLLPENRAPTVEAIRSHGADLGIAWDGDFDRCFFFDHQGRFIEGYYIVGLLAAAFLQRQVGDTVIHDPRLTWNTIDIADTLGGRAVCSRTGHSFIKESMRRQDAVYGGEMSAHHYFRDFAYCDSGMIPWLLVTEMMGRRRCRLSELVAERQQRFPVSGEINRRVGDADAVLAALHDRWRYAAVAVDDIDGLSMEFADWRFNVRKSNTEPLLRLNVESRGDEALMRQRTAELLDLLGGEG